MKRLKKLTATVAAASLLLSSCVTSGTGGGGGATAVGPQPSSTQGRQALTPEEMGRPRLDIIIPVFDPGIAAKDEKTWRNIEENDWMDEKDRPVTADEYVWPELRRAEAIRFSWKLKEALEKTGKFGAVRVTPDASATGDLYLLGRLQESDGKEVAVEIEGVAIDGKRWFTKEFDHEVEDGYYKQYRNKGKDAYDPLFQKIAEYIVGKLKKYDATELHTIRRITDLRFASHFTEKAFSDHLIEKRGTYKLASFPAAGDPMLTRTRAIRVRDQLFVDAMQKTYMDFSDEMEDSYLLWQKQSAFEIEAKKQAQSKATGQAVLGILSVVLAGAAVAAASNSNNAGTQSAALTGAAIAGIAGASLISQSFQTSKEAEVHRDILRELGDSIDLELAPRVVKFEEETVELQGTASEQFAQWRTFLGQVYDAESVPDTKL